MLSKPFVIIGTPCFGGLVTQNYMQSIISLMQYSASNYFDVSLAMLGYDALITRSRNTIVSTFMNTPHATHLMFIDADIGFDPAQIARMLRFDQDLVAGMYPLKVLDWGRALTSKSNTGETAAQTALHYVGTPCTGAELEKRDGFSTGLYAGTGFMMIKRTVITQLMAAHPELKYKAVHAHSNVAQSQENNYGLFDCLIDEETKVYLSEDYAFCKRWRALGGKIWLDTNGALTHTGVYDFQGNAGLRFA